MSDVTTTPTDDQLFDMLQTVLDLRDERIHTLIDEIDGLRVAMESRAVIEQAKGVLMSTLGCTADAAFAVLVQQSQQQNRRVADIAAELAILQSQRSVDGDGHADGHGAERPS
jgi:AmiR/NasT family two-component response regulator